MSIKGEDIDIVPSLEASSNPPTTKVEDESLINITDGETATGLSSPKAESVAADDDSANNTSVAYDEDGMPIPKGIEDVDEDDLEQTGESMNLDLSKAGNQVWLVKLTPQLADIWKNEDFLRGQELGQIKIQRGASPPKILLDLNDNIVEHRSVDKEYQLRLTKQVVENEYIFSETEYDHFKHRLMYRTQVVDMPYQPKLRSMNKEAQNHAATWTRKTKAVSRELPESGMGTTRITSNLRAHSRFKKFVPYAKTIPKKTEIVGKVVHECQVIPTKLAANNKLKLAEQKRRLAHMVKKKRINYLRDANTGILQGRAGPNIHTGATITLSRELAAKREAAKSEGRAARMDKEIMMKILFDLFNQYDYWTMKGLKEKTNQPEAYLKECLENIAVMERKGPYALKYRLKDEYKKSRDVERTAKQGIDLDDMDDKGGELEDDSDEDVEMEDVAEV
ncbi:DEKNAAC103377 [Brettanomyces naardenensis]|uniref:Transcription initiation factor IIF subunit beta n=1 Tax=Brettanomyces naardenensis TaxID=13370 RepID=A0A448YN46_BRENA|nr:DEKNAAC103377 [Brettanomyces naardenensis]